jgi:hypothetical protein
MCFFISAILPISANISVLAGVMDRYGRALKPQSNPALEAQLQPGERLLLTTAGHCDCGTALGALERKAALLERRRRSDERKEASLRRKGWGESRIQRWRNPQQKVSSGHDPQAGMIDWERLLTDLLSPPRTPYVGLLQLRWHPHQYEQAHCGRFLTDPGTPSLNAFQSPVIASPPLRRRLAQASRLSRTVPASHAITTSRPSNRKLA